MTLIYHRLQNQIYITWCLMLVSIWRLLFHSAENPHLSSIVSSDAEGGRADISSSGSSKLETTTMHGMYSHLRLRFKVEFLLRTIGNWSFFLNTIFLSSHMYPENPRRTREIVGFMNIGHWTLNTRHCQDSNSQHVSSQVCGDSTVTVLKQTRLATHWDHIVIVLFSHNTSRRSMDCWQFTNCINLILLHYLSQNPKRYLKSYFLLLNISDSYFFVIFIKYSFPWQ